MLPCKIWENLAGAFNLKNPRIGDILSIKATEQSALGNAKAPVAGTTGAFLRRFG